VQGTSKTWGGVYHFPKALMSKLPGDMTFSVLFDRSENFKPDAARLEPCGLPIPNATGTTTEYGFVVTGLSDKISLKVDWFKTIVKNASLGETDGNSIAGLGSNAYFIADGVIWGYGWADGAPGRPPRQPGERPSSVTPGTNYWDYGAGADFAIGSPQYIAINAASAAIVNAWVNNPFSANFFNSYNLTPPINPTLAKSTGLLRTRASSTASTTRAAPTRAAAPTSATTRRRSTTCPRASRSSCRPSPPGTGTSRSTTPT
jgi:hypothetical protein